MVMVLLSISTLPKFVNVGVATTAFVGILNKETANSLINIREYRIRLRNSNMSWRFMTRTGGPKSAFATAFEDGD